MMIPILIYLWAAGAIGATHYAMWQNEYGLTRPSPWVSGLVGLLWPVLTLWLWFEIIRSKI